MATPFTLGGLLGTSFGGGLSSLNDLLTEEQRAAIQQQAGLSAAAALLQAAGPSTTPTSLGQALGSAFTAGQAGMQKGTESALTQMLTRQKLEEAKRAQDLQKRIAGIFDGGQAPAGGAITPQEALAAPGMAAGPTVQRAALIGQPRTEAAGPQLSAAEQRAQTYRQIADLYAARGFSEDAKRYEDIAERLAPSRPEVVGAPIKTKTGYVQYTKTGQFIPVPKDFEPVSKPTGAPEVRTDAATGRQVLVQGYEDGSYQTVPGYGPARKFREIQRGGSVVLIDENAIPATGIEISKTLAPQIVGGAETGFFQVGGGRGGIPPLSAPAAAPAPAAAAPAPAAPARAPAAVAAPAAAPAAAPTGPAPVTTGLQPIIPGTGKAFQNEKDMRAEFTTAVKPYVELSQAFQKIESAAKNPSGAGDISLVYGYMKVLDPGSVVREGEFATAQNAGGVPDGIRSLYNRALSGQRLSESVRTDFLSQARNLIESQRVLSDDLVNRYKDLATQYNLNPGRVVFDPFQRIKKPEQIIEGATPATAPRPAASAASSTRSARRFYDQFNLIERD